MFFNERILNSYVVYLRWLPTLGDMWQKCRGQRDVFRKLEADFLILKPIPDSFLHINMIYTNTDDVAFCINSK